VKLATWNVNGIRARHAQVHDWIEHERPDVICLQELKAAADSIPITLQFEDYWCYWHGGKGYSGVALLISRRIAPDRPDFAHPSFDYENRIVTAALKTAVGELTVASVYVPNGGKDFPSKMRFLESVDEYAAARHAASEALVLCGDLNVARAEIDVHPKERKPRAIGQLPEERALLERIIGRGLVDVGRAVDPDNDGLFTWWAPWRNLRQRNIGWRLDYVLASASVAARVTACPVQKDVGTSDHAPVMAVLE
jgi:exodeoxyribonuclease III